MDYLTEPEAVCLYTGMMTDTGAFTYASSRSVIYECISLLLARGIDKDRIYRNVFWTSTPNRMRLVGYMLYVKMETIPGMNATVMTLTNQERRMLGVKNGDTEGIVNMPLQIQGMRLSVFISEDTEHPGFVKFSLRSVDDFPCNEMSARFFNGGGHKNASGGRLQCSIEEAVELFHRAVREYAPLLKN
jgi:phosphoesterase RecJ-like protein